MLFPGDGFGVLLVRDTELIYDVIVVLSVTMLHVFIWAGLVCSLHVLAVSVCSLLHLDRYQHGTFQM